MIVRTMLWSLAGHTHRHRYAIGLATLLLIAVLKDWPPPSCEKKG